MESFLQPFWHRIYGQVPNLSRTGSARRGSVFLSPSYHSPGPASEVGRSWALGAPPVSGAGARARCRVPESSSPVLASLGAARGRGLACILDVCSHPQNGLPPGTSARGPRGGFSRARAQERPSRSLAFARLQIREELCSGEGRARPGPRPGLGFVGPGTLRCVAGSPLNPWLPLSRCLDCGVPARGKLAACLGQRRLQLAFLRHSQFSAGALSAS